MDSHLRSSQAGNSSKSQQNLMKYKREQNANDLAPFRDKCTKLKGLPQGHQLGDGGQSYAKLEEDFVITNHCLLVLM